MLQVKNCSKLYQLNFYSWPLQISAVLVASYFYLPVLQPRYSLVIIVSCSNIIDSWPLYKLFQLPINVMECFSTAYLFYIGLQILGRTFFYSKGVLGGGGGYH